MQLRSHNMFYFIQTNSTVMILIVTLSYTMHEWLEYFLNYTLKNNKCERLYAIY